MFCIFVKSTIGTTEEVTGGNACKDTLCFVAMCAGRMCSTSVTQQHVTCQHIYEAFPKLLSVLTHF